MNLIETQDERNSQDVGVEQYHELCHQQTIGQHLDFDKEAKKFNSGESSDEEQFSDGIEGTVLDGDAFANSESLDVPNLNSIER